MKVLSKFSDRSIKIFLYLFFALGTLISSINLCVPGVLDEVGTIANTAFLAGDDWSKCVQSMGGFYYKYGLSILLYPLYLIFQDSPYVLYPVFVAFQMLILSFIPVIAYHIARKYFKVESKLTALFLSLAGTGISSIWLYAEYTRGDVVLIFVPWLVMWILLKLSTLDDTQKKEKKLFSVLLAFTAVYAYAAHSRGIVTVLAATFTLIFISLFAKRHLVNYLWYFPSLGLFMVIDKIISSLVEKGVFGKYEPKHSTLDSFNISIFMKLFSKNGIIIYTKTMIGWFLNLEASTLGLIIVGLIATVFITLRLIRKKSTFTVQEDTGSFFILMLFLGSFFMGSLFFFPYAYELFMGITVSRADRIVFGRYTVSTVGPMCFYTLYILVARKDEIIRWKSRIFSILSFATIIAIFSKWIGPALDNVSMTDSRYFLSLTTFLKIENANTTASFPELNQTLVMTAIIALVIFIVIMILSAVNRKSSLVGLCIIIFAVSLVNYCVVFVNVRNVRDDSYYTKNHAVIEFIDELDKKANLSEEYPCIYIAQEKKGTIHNKRVNSPYVTTSSQSPFTAVNPKHYQFSLTNYDCCFLKYILDDSDQDGFLVIAHRSAIKQSVDWIHMLSEDRNLPTDDVYYTFDAFDYKNATRDVVYVKGTKLKQYLEDHGYKLTEHHRDNK
ncbi:MAG: hypothetical protein K6G85_00210 [Eubacterium sp.]|nr:hypothetical protein [Eubacterium sp.]